MQVIGASPHEGDRPSLEEGHEIAQLPDRKEEGGHTLRPNRVIAP
jgi:hypothetical protein